MDEFDTGQKHLLSGADLETYIDIHVVPHGYQPIGEDNSGYLAQHSQAYSRRVGLDGLGQLPINERGTLIIDPRVGEAHQPWMATHLGD